MARAKAKKKIMGYGTWVKRVDDDAWTRVGYLFHSRSEARDWMRKQYPVAVAWKVEAIRVGVEPIKEIGRNRFESGKEAA
jgi:hypothetical protein